MTSSATGIIVYYSFLCKHLFTSEVTHDFFIHAIFHDKTSLPRCCIPYPVNHKKDALFFYLRFLLNQNLPQNPAVVKDLNNKPSYTVRLHPHRAAPLGERQKVRQVLFEPASFDVMPRPDAAGDPPLEAQEGERPPQRLPVDVQGGADLPLAGKPASARRVGFLEKAEEPLLRPLERRDFLNGPSASPPDSLSPAPATGCSVPYPCRRRGCGSSARGTRPRPPPSSPYPGRPAPRPAGQRAWSREASRTP